MKEVKPCPIYGTVYCPMAWISYGFERVYYERCSLSEVFNEKKLNLISNLFIEQQLPSCVMDKDTWNITGWSGVCPHWLYFNLFQGTKEDKYYRFDYKDCNFYKRYKKLGEGTITFYSKLTKFKNPYFDDKEEKEKEVIVKEIIKEVVKEVEKPPKKLSTEKNWTKFKIGNVPMRK